MGGQRCRRNLWSRWSGRQTDGWRRCNLWSRWSGRQTDGWTSLRLCRWSGLACCWSEIAACRWSDRQRVLARSFHLGSNLVHDLQVFADDMCCRTPAPNMPLRIRQIQMQKVHRQNDAHRSCAMGACSAMDHDTLPLVAQGVLNAAEQRLERPQALPAIQSICQRPAIYGEDLIVWCATPAHPLWASHIPCAIDHEAYVVVLKALEVICCQPASLEDGCLVLLEVDDPVHGLMVLALAIAPLVVLVVQSVRHGCDWRGPKRKSRWSGRGKKLLRMAAANGRNGCGWRNMFCMRDGLCNLDNPHPT